MKRIHRLMLATLATVSIFAPPLFAQTENSPTAPNAQGDVSVTIYNNDRALVEDVRQLNIPAGVVKQEFPDVSAAIMPQTVSFNAAGASIVEQNFDYDLLSPNAMMDKAVGETVTLLRTNPATGAETRERAKILAVNGGVVMQIGERIEILRDDGLPVRVIFDRIPENLRAKPTLSVTLDSERGGVRPATLTYLTGRMSWAADYVSMYDEAAGTIDVQGWVTLTNNTGTTFKAANTLLVAGSPGGNNNQYNQYNQYGGYQPDRGMIQAGTETPGREQLGDYYLYPLAERTTIANAQTKQVSFLDVQKVPATKAYQFIVQGFNSLEEPQSAKSVIKFTSSRNGGLGDALPAGTVRFYMRDKKGDPQFIGESRIGHTPMGSALGLATGDAFDVKVKATVEKRERINPRKWRTTMRYELTNARDRSVTVDLQQRGVYWFWDDTRIVSESMRSKRVNDETVEWSVPISGNGDAIVTATFETRY